MKKVAMFLMSLMIVVVFASCEKVNVDKKQEGAVKQESPQNETGSTTVMTSPGAVANIVVGNKTFAIEIAQTDEERASGLMNRESLPEDNGMWFVFPGMVQEKFWMKDTMIPLDLVFVDEGMKVVHIIENAPAQSTELLVSPVPFQYVLEVNAGTVAKNAIKVGDTVEKRLGPK